MPFYKLVMLLFVFPNWLLKIIAIVLVSAQAIYLNIIINNNEVLYRNTNLPALIYPMVISFMPQLLWLHPILFVNAILLFALNRIFSTYKHPNPLSRYFDIGFLIAMASLFYFPAVFLILLVFVSLAIIRPFVWREWVSTIIGLLLPYFFISVYYFWTDRLNYFWLKVIPYQISDIFLLQSFYSYISKGIIAVTGIILILALIRLRTNFTKNAIKTREFQKITVVYLFLSILIYVITEDTFSYSIAITAIPASVLSAYYFLTLRKKWIYESLFFAWLLAIIFSILKITL